MKNKENGMVKIHTISGIEIPIVNIPDFSPCVHNTTSAL